MIRVLVLYTYIDGCRASVDVCASFLFVGDLNGHHQGWLTITNRRAVAAFDFSTVADCDQFVGPTHARRGTLDLLMIDVPDL